MAWRGVLVLLVAAGLVGCSSGGSDHTSTPSLRTAARHYADAFLHGSVRDLEQVYGRSCQVSKVGSKYASEKAMLARFHEDIARMLGRPLAKVDATGVELRHVTPTRGEAQVEYNLPRARAGNDNWVAYQVEDGAWKVTDCKAPIGGSSRSSTSDTDETSSGSATQLAPPPGVSGPTSTTASGTITCSFTGNGHPKASNPPQCSEPGAAQRYTITCEIEGDGSFDATNAPECF